MAGKRRKEQQHGAASETPSSSTMRSHRSKHDSRRHEDEEDDETHEYLEPKLSARILEDAMSQQNGILAEEEANKSGPGYARDAFSVASAAVSAPVDFDSDADDADGGSDLFPDTQSQYDGYHEIDEEDDKILAAFMSKDAGPQRALADIIIERIKEKDVQVASEARPLPQIDNNIIELYKGVGKLLRWYTTGKLPKAFKVVPSLSLREDVLYITEPEKWSPNTMYQATRIFASNLSVKRAQRFYNPVLLPRVRDDIQKNKRLHFALYQSLKKSLYKPAAFFKGFFLPLCQKKLATEPDSTVSATGASESLTS